MGPIHQSPQELHIELEALRARLAELEALESTSRQPNMTLLDTTETWRQSFNALSDDVVILDRSRSVLWANKAFRKRFESRGDRVIGMDCQFLYCGTVSSDLQTPWETVLHGARSASVETFLPHLQGWFSVSCYPLFDQNGMQWGAISICKDMTDRRRVEDALRDIAQGSAAPGGAAFFRWLVKDLCKALDVQHTFLAEFSDQDTSQCQTIAVWSRNKHANHFTWHMANSPGLQILKSKIPTWGENAQSEYPLDPLVATWNVHTFIGAPLLNATGQITGILVAMSEHPLRNVPLAQSLLGVFAVRAASELERKRAEEAQRDNEERYRAIAEHAYDLILETQPNGSLLYLSPSCHKVLGYDLSNLQNTSFLDLLHPEEKNKISAAFEYNATNLKEWDMSCQLHHQSGEWRWFESHVKPFRTSTGDIVAVIVLRDITERRRLDEEHLRATKLESISLLAGGIAHDFNNILTAVFANVGLAKMMINKEMRNPDNTIVERLSAAEKACVRARDLTKQLLTFAKGGTPVKNPASIGRFINETVEFALRGSNVRCDQNLQEHLWPVEIDEAQMSQVLHNLIINADHSMPNGGVMAISAHNVRIEAIHGLPLKPGPYVQVSIQDQGTGIHPEHKSKIFDPYFTTKEKGHGLGLATAYSVIKRHGGHIMVQSELGVGSTFSFYLPASGKVHELLPPEDSVFPPGSGKILVMEDQKDIQEILGTMLTHLGYEADFVNNGTDALRRYQSALSEGQPYRATIMDLTIPGGLGGRETIQQLRSIDPEVVALLSSGYSNDAVMAEPHKYGFNGIVSKPYNLEELAKALNHALGLDKPPSIPPLTSP